MPNNNRVFISFAIEDATLRDLLVGQARNNRSPFSFVDMSVKQPWDNAWKTRCRTKIKGCDGVVGLITNNTPAADGQIWELQCAYDEGIPVMLMYGNSSRPGRLPRPIAGKRINLWSWPNLSSFLNRL